MSNINENKDNVANVEADNPDPCFLDGLVVKDAYAAPENVTPSSTGANQILTDSATHPSLNLDSQGVPRRQTEMYRSNSQPQLPRKAPRPDYCPQYSGSRFLNPSPAASEPRYFNVSPQGIPQQPQMAPYSYGAFQPTVFYQSAPTNPHYYKSSSTDYRLQNLLDISRDLSSLRVQMEELNAVLQNTNFELAQLKKTEIEEHEKTRDIVQWEIFQSVGIQSKLDEKTASDNKETETNKTEKRQISTEVSKHGKKILEIDPTKLQISTEVSKHGKKILEIDPTKLQISTEVSKHGKKILEIDPTKLQISTEVSKHGKKILEIDPTKLIKPSTGAIPKVRSPKTTIAEAPKTNTSTNSKAEHKKTKYYLNKKLNRKINRLKEKAREMGPILEESEGPSDTSEPWDFGD